MKATIRVDIKGDGTSVAFDFDLADPADRSRFKATCGLLSRPEVTGESRERFLRQVVAVVDDVVAGKVPGQPPSRVAAPSPFSKTALDVAIDRSRQPSAVPPLSRPVDYKHLAVPFPFLDVRHFYTHLEDVPFLYARWR